MGTRLQSGQLKCCSQGGKKWEYTIAVNDKLWNKECEATWNPVFSPDSTKVLLRTIENGTYYRRIIPISDIS